MFQSQQVYNASLYTLNDLSVLQQASRVHLFKQAKLVAFFSEKYGAARISLTKIIIDDVARWLMRIARRSRAPQSIKGWQ